MHAAILSRVRLRQTLSRRPVAACVLVCACLCVCVGCALRLHGREAREGKRQLMNWLCFPAHTCLRVSCHACVNTTSLSVYAHTHARTRVNEHALVCKPCVSTLVTCPPSFPHPQSSHAAAWQAAAAQQQPQQQQHQLHQHQQQAQERFPHLWFPSLQLSPQVRHHGRARQLCKQQSARRWQEHSPSAAAA